MHVTMATAAGKACHRTIQADGSYACCIGPACMAWEWVQEFEFKHQADSPGEDWEVHRAPNYRGGHTLWRRKIPAAERLGYCGVAMTYVEVNK